MSSFSWAVKAFLFFTSVFWYSQWMCWLYRRCHWPLAEYLWDVLCLGALCSSSHSVLTADWRRRLLWLPVLMAELCANSHLPPVLFLLFLLLVFALFCFCLFVCFKTGFLYVSLAVLKLTHSVGQAALEHKYPPAPASLGLKAWAPTPGHFPPFEHPTTTAANMLEFKMTSFLQRTKISLV